MATRADGMGTFGGVFTPSILTILGLILFLRLGYVIGTVGLWQALLIIAVASAVSILTSISLAAIATNLEVKGGGVYYIISRTLGIAFGGAIGLVLFIALAISVGFYCVGFSEGVMALFPGNNVLLQQGIAGGAVLVMIGIAWFGAEWATRVQYVVMGFLVLALVAFGLGVAGHWDMSVLTLNLEPLSGFNNFWIAFAIFFPAVTGFTQGVNMSGDLAAPHRAIPLGTALAVGVSIIVYVAAAVLLAGTVPRVTLLADYGAMRQVAIFSPLIDAGIIAATLSSALASLMGAPRILQSLAKDRVFPFLAPFAKGDGPSDNPRRGILLGGGIALAVVALGNLNEIAAVVSMFFVATYALLNYATYYEGRAQSPSFRPALGWYRPEIGLAGALLSVGVMLAINLPAALISIAVLFAIFQFLRQNIRAARWADGERSYRLKLVRENLHGASRRAEHPRDWRPQILAFSDSAERREHLLTFSGWLEGNAGMTTAIRILEGKGRHARRARERAEEELEEELEAKKLTAFPLVISAPDLDQAVQVAAQSVGIGPTRINTVLVNWPESMPGGTPAGQRLFRNLHATFSWGLNLLLLNADEEDWTRLDGQTVDERRIDIWWRDDSTGRLLLTLAYLLTRNEGWRRVPIRLLISGPKDKAEALTEKLATIAGEARIPAKPFVIEAEGGGEHEDTDALIAASADASVVFVGVGVKNQRFIHASGTLIAELLPHLPITLLAMAAEEIDLVADPDEGEESERALEEAAARESEAEAVKAAAAAEAAAKAEAKDGETPEA